MEILKFIKEFQEDYFKCDIDDKSYDQLISLKRSVLMTKYRDHVPITWRLFESFKNKTNISGGNF
jgi:hypothetical protein